jgi:DNA invertase Pin-like site-specific DNA recombinase
MIRFAFYGRVSTEDQQDPESSKQWQLHRSRQLIEPAGGVIVTEFFDIGQSRSLPWKRRPEAASLLATIARPNRGFDAVVIGEPQRAFYGNQFGLTFPVFTHYGVGLWVPEVGGAIDPGSEAHDLVMTLFGGMSKGERTRIKTRVRSAMTAQAAIEGRFLGGRPPYGYRLADAGPHPNPSKAADGKRLQVLEPDSITAPVVKRIFDEYLAGRGCYAIAEQLNRDGIPSPSGHDRDRNRHRHGLAWGKSAIRAILRNPRYTGYEVWARQRRDEVLMDVEDVSAGHQTIMRWNSEESWVWSAEPAHEPLITRETFDAAQRRMTGRVGGRGARTASRRYRTYALRHRVGCGFCGRYMQGSVSGGRTYYRCKFANEYSLATESIHPRSVNLREDDLLPHLDTWLAELFGDEHIDDTCAAMAAIATTEAAVDTSSIKAAIRESDRKLERYRQALEAGTDPTIVAGWIKQVTTERAAAETQLRQAQLKATETVTAAELRAELEAIGGLLPLLEESDPALKARFYEEVGLDGTYDPGSESSKLVSSTVVSEGGLEPPRRCGH